MDYFFISLQYLLQIFGYSFIYLAIACLIFYFLKIQDSKVKIFILILGLLKPFIVVIRLIDFKSNNIYNQFSYFSFINNQISNLMNYNQLSKINFILINKLILSFYIIAIIIVTLFRFYQTYVNFHKLKKIGRVTESADYETNKIILNYSNIMKIRAPKIYFSEDLKNSFYVFGFIKKKIIINKNIFYFLNKEEKETVLLHELCHLKRHDNILNAILIYLTDIHFYNPFSYIIYGIIKNEQEKDCDKLAIKYSQKSNKEIAINILNSILKVKKIIFNEKIYCPNIASPFSDKVSIEEKTMRKRINTLLSFDPQKLNANIFTKIILYSFFLGLVLF